MKPVKIGFVLLSNSRDPLPSTRITVLNMLPFLREGGFDPHVVFEPTQAVETPDVGDLAQRLLTGDFRAVFFQKVHGRSVEELVRRLSASGIKTVYGVCDLVNAAMADVTDATIAVTEYLKSLYPQALQPKIEVVHDGIENPNACKLTWEDHSGSRRRPLRAVLVTSSTLTRLPVLNKPPEWLEVSIVGRYPPAAERLRRLREARWKMALQPPGDRLAYASFLLNPRIRRVEWDPVGVYEQLQQADIGIIPVETSTQQEAAAGVPDWRVKSENRLTMKMAVGLPVVATPIPAYEPVIQQGVNGFLARSTRDWIASLEALRDPDLRRDVGERARRSVLDQYSMQEQGRRLVAILQNLLSDSPRLPDVPVEPHAQLAVANR